MTDGTTRLVLLNWSVGVPGLVIVWTHQKYWQDSGMPLAYFGVLFASYNLIFGFAGRAAALVSARYGRRPVFAAIGLLPIVASFGMASFFGWGGIVLGALGQIGRGLASVVFLNALNEKISSAFRATVISMAQLGTRASFALLGPLVGYGIDRSGIAVRLVGVRHPVLYRLRLPAPSAGRARDTAEAGRLAHRVLAGPSRRPWPLRDSPGFILWRSSAMRSLPGSQPHGNLVYSKAEWQPPVATTR